MKLYFKFLPLVVTLTLSLNPAPSYAVTMKEARQEGLGFGKSFENIGASVITQSNKESVPGYTTDNPPETKYYEDPNFQANAAQNINDSEMTEYITKTLSNLPKVQISEDDPSLANAKYIKNHESEVIQMITTEYSDCSVLSKNQFDLSSKEEKTCITKKAYKDKVCEQTLKVSCSGECQTDSGNIDLSSLESDMRWDYQYPIITSGTISDNYWSGSCAVYDRSTKFEIKDIKRIKEFTLIKAGFDDHILIKLNGHVVYVGPYGGSDLHVVNGRVSTGSGTYSCELGRNWVRNLSIDLKPHLQNGFNTIETRVVVSGHGEGWLQIRAKQYCCNSTTDNWEEACYE